MKRLSLAALAGALGTVGLLAFGQSSIAVTAPIVVAQDDDAALLVALMEEGEDLFNNNCATCHGRDGEGGAGPELAGNPYVQSAGAVAAQILAGNIDRGMPPFSHLTDREVAAVGTYVRNSWGAAFGIIRETTVAVRR